MESILLRGRSLFDLFFALNQSAENDSLSSLNSRFNVIDLTGLITWSTNAHISRISYKSCYQYDKIILFLCAVIFSSSSGDYVAIASNMPRIQRGRYTIATSRGTTPYTNYVWMGSNDTTIYLHSSITATELWVDFTYLSV